MKTKHLAREIWKTLTDQYTGIGALDASILMSHLHCFQLDDSKPLESQINQMSDMCSQLATMGDKISDAKFAIIISGALPSLYDTLKTMAIASVTDMSQLMSNTLIQQILREEKCKGNQDSAAGLLAKQQKTPDKSSGLKQSQKSKKGKNRLCCLKSVVTCKQSVGIEYSNMLYL